MSYNEIFYLVYISQIVFISVIIPFWFKQRVDHMMANHPPEDFPKLYPVSIESINHAVKTFKFLNACVVLLGLVILGVTISMGADELLNWDTQSMLIIVFWIQLIPFMYIGLSGLKYQQLMRQVDQHTQKYANLQPRNIFQFVPQYWLSALVITLLAYVMLVIYIQQNPFPGFAGYINILWVVLLNGFYLIMTQRLITGRKKDPHQSHEDRMIHTHMVAKVLILGAVLANVFLTISMLLSVLDLRHIGDIVQSLYFQIVALLMSQVTTYKPDNYDVYRADAKTA